MPRPKKSATKRIPEFVVELASEQGEFTEATDFDSAKESAVEMLQDSDEGDYATIYELTPRFTVRIGATQIDKI